MVLYNGEHVKLIDEFRYNKTERTFEDVGKSRTVERFMPKHDYQIFHAGNLNRIRLRDKDIFDLLGYESEAKDYLKSKGIRKPKSQEDFLILFDFYEQLLSQS